MLCHASESLLLLVDMQARLIAAMPEAARPALLRNNTVLLEAAALLNIPVLISEQYPKGLGKTDSGIMQKLPPAIHSFEKTNFSCYGAGGFMQAVNAHGRRQIIICGLETHVCVLQTALELSSAGLQVFVVEDATCSRNLSNSQNALARMRAADVIVSNTESVLFEWLRDANHEHFKTISALLR